MNLELAGHEVIEAANGETGLELALGEQPDVVVLDVMLPGWTASRSWEPLRTTNRPATSRSFCSQPRRSSRGPPGRVARRVQRVPDETVLPGDLVGIAERAQAMSAVERSDRRQRELAQLGT